MATQTSERESEPAGVFLRYATVQDIDEVKSRLDRQDDRFDRVDDRFDRVDDKFDRQDAKMDEGFRQLNARIDKLYYWIIGFGVSIIVGIALIGVRTFIS